MDKLLDIWGWNKYMNECTLSPWMNVQYYDYNYNSHVYNLWMND